MAQALVVDEEEGFVLLDGAPQRAAELIPREGRLLAGDVELVRGVQGAVADKFVGRSVQVVGARLGDRVDRRAGAAELRAVGVGQNLNSWIASMPREVPIADPGAVVLRVADIGSSSM